MSHCRALFLGDSHVAGVGDPTGLGWSGRVAAAAHRAGKPITAYNLGLRTETSLGVIWRWHDEVMARLHPQDDCRAVVSFGINDVLKHGPGVRRRVPKHLGHLIDELSPLGLPAFVVGPAPIADPECSDHLAEISRAFAPVCEERAVPYAPIFDSLADSALWTHELAAGDGIHPGAAGYELLASLVIERGLIDWLLDPEIEPQGLPHRRFAPSRPDQSSGRVGQRGNGSPADSESR